MHVNDIAEQVGPRFAPSRCSLSTFEVYHPRQGEVLAKLRSLDLPAMAASGQGLVLYGPTGSGKDHLAIALLYRAAYLHTITGRWVNFLTWYRQMVSIMRADGDQEYEVRELAKPKILVISEPTSPSVNKAPTPASIEMLYDIVDRRYRKMASTWVTANVASPDDLKAALGDPVFDRLQERATFVQCFWPTNRKPEPVTTNQRATT